MTSLVPGPLPNGDYRNEDVRLRYGKIRFLYTVSSFDSLKKQMGNGVARRAFFILRPGELGLDQKARPVYEVHDLEGRVVLQIFDLYL